MGPRCATARTLRLAILLSAAAAVALGSRLQPTAGISNMSGGGSGGCYGAGDNAPLAAARPGRALLTAIPATSPPPLQQPGLDQVHRPFQLTAPTSVALVLSLAVSALSNAAGVGGGAIFVPLFNVLLAFDIKLATALSQAVITGGALGSVAYSISRRHPRDRRRPLLDFDLALTLTPALLLGVSGGVLLNIALPAWLLTFLLILLLVYLAVRTFGTGLRMHRAEQRAHALQLAQAQTPQQQQPQQQQQQHCMQRRQQQHLEEPPQGPLAASPCCSGSAAKLQGGQQGRHDLQQQEQQRWQQQQQPASHKLLLELGRLDPGGDQGSSPSGAAAAAASEEWQIAAAASVSRANGSSSGSCSDRGGSARRATPDAIDHTQPLYTQPLSVAGLGGAAADARCPAQAEGLQLADRGQQRKPQRDQGKQGKQQQQRQPQQEQQPRDDLPPDGRVTITVVNNAAAGCCCTGAQPLVAPNVPGAAAASDGGGGDAGGLLADGGSAACWAPPLVQLAEMALCWLAFLGFQLGKEEYPRCSWQYGLLFGCQAAVALALTTLFSWQATRGRERQATNNEAEACMRQPILSNLLDSSAQSASCGSRPGAAMHGACSLGASGVGQVADVADCLPGWTRRQLATASAVSLGAGAVAGTLGIGGGMVMAPLLLELGVHPQSASATSGLMVLFSASTAVLAFGAAQRLNLQYAAAFGAACLAAAFAGNFLIGRAVRRSGRSSLLILILAGIIAAGAAVTVAFSGRHAVLDLVTGSNLGLGAFCS